MAAGMTANHLLMGSIPIALIEFYYAGPVTQQ